jgi:hypothetical protein
MDTGFRKKSGSNTEAERDDDSMKNHREPFPPHHVLSNSSRPISMRRISLVPAPIS